MLTAEYRINGYLIGESTFTLQATRSDGLSMYTVQHWQKSESGDVDVRVVVGELIVWHKRSEGMARLTEIALEALRERKLIPPWNKR